MKRFMQSTLALLLALMMVFGAAPLSGFVGLQLPDWLSSGFLNIKVSAYTEGIYAYSVSSGKATITDCADFAGGAITIPSVLSGCPVTSIGDYAFSGCTYLMSITIPDSVTSIGDYAFYCCTRLTSIIIGNGVTSIGDYAFFGCTGLTSITIGNGVTSIEGVFNGCTGLTSITIGNGVTSIGNSAFSGFTDLTSVTIGNGVTSIGDGAFFGCTGLTSIIIPESVTSIGGAAFSSCTILTNITIGNSVTSIGNSAFYGCSKLMSITIPNSVTSIGDYAFRSCTSLTSVIIPDSVTSIGGSAFYGCTGLTSVSIGKSVTSIGDNAFYGCTGLTSVFIPDSVASIKLSAFRSCTSLTSITIPDSVTSIGNFAFYGDANLTIYCNVGSFAEYYALGNNIPHSHSLSPGSIFTITFESNGGSPVTAIAQNYNTPVAKPTDPAKTGYYFAGWYADAALTAAVSWPYTMRTVNVTFYAKWTVNQCTIKITRGNDDVGEKIETKLKWYQYYKNISLDLGFVDSGIYASIKWSSDNEKVVVGQNGHITNIKSSARSANIKIEMLDAQGGVLASDTVKVIFYKYNWQLSKLRSQAIVSNNFAQ